MSSLFPSCSFNTWILLDGQSRPHDLSDIIHHINRHIQCLARYAEACTFVMPCQALLRQPCRVHQTVVPCCVDATDKYSHSTIQHVLLTDTLPCKPACMYAACHSTVLQKLTPHGSANMRAPVAAFACMCAACPSHTLSKPHPSLPLPCSPNSSAKLCRAYFKLATVPGSTAGGFKGRPGRAGAAVAAATAGKPGIPAATPASAD